MDRWRQNEWTNQIYVTIICPGNVVVVVVIVGSIGQIIPFFFCLVCYYCLVGQMTNEMIFAEIEMIENLILFFPNIILDDHCTITIYIINEWSRKKNNNIYWIIFNHSIDFKLINKQFDKKNKMVMSER